MTNEAHKKHNLEKIPDDLLVAYYEHQYDRMKQLEDQRVTLTNIISSISILAFTFGFDQTASFSRQAGFTLLAIIIVVNFFAIAYIVKTGSWISTHRKRAKGILAFRSRVLAEFDKNTHADFQNWIPGRAKIQILLHCVFVVMAVIMMVTWAVT